MTAVTMPGRILTPPYLGDLFTVFVCCKDRMARLFMEPGRKSWRWLIKLQPNGSLLWTDAPDRKRR